MELMKPKRRLRHYSSLFALLLFTTCVSAQQQATIHNDVFWNTVDGKPIYSQGGGIFKFKDTKTGESKYYWYGVHYKGAETYRNDPSVTQKGSGFESVTCYSSADLVNWTFESDVLTKDEVLRSNGRLSWVGRLGVAYIKDLNVYALLVQHGNGVLVATSASPVGPFKFDQQIDMTPFIGTPNTGDQTVFTDEDTGKSYLVYSYGKGRNKTYLSEIGVKNGKVSLLDCVKIYEGQGREGNCMFKYKGKYYACASDLYGWDASHAYYLVADHIRGPYKPNNQMEVIDGCTDDYGHITQTGFFYTVRGSKQETIIYCGDRWADFAGNGLGYNQWCPLSFAGKKPYFNSLSAWTLDVQTGEWFTQTDNNYVKNGSFEADRKRIPSIVKPVQLQLSGWETIITKGRKISLDTSSTALNHNNAESDRKIVVGEKSLNLSDKVDFSRKVTQTIRSTPYVKLPDGYYNLSAKVKNSVGFTQLTMYADVAGKVENVDIKGEHATWAAISLNHVLIKGGSLQIGFIAEGVANSFCYVDDVSLVKAVPINN